MAVQAHPRGRPLAANANSAGARPLRTSARLRSLSRRNAREASRFEGENTPAE